MRMLRIIRRRQLQQVDGGRSICMLGIVVFDILSASPSLASGEQVFKSSERRIMIFDIVFVVPSLVAGEGIAISSEHLSVTVSID